MLSGSEHHLVAVAFQSMDPNNTGMVALSEVKKRYFAHAHPRVKEGSMAPSAARDTLDYHFGVCAADHEGSITFDEFLAYHEKVADEAYDEHVGDVAAFTEKTIMGLWRLGDVLLPTGVRPAFPVTQAPTGFYAVTLMTLVWVERRQMDASPASAQQSSSSGGAAHDDLFVLRGIKDVVRPIFTRGDLPDELQGYFAYPEELSGMAIDYVAPRLSIQRWYDFTWEYSEGKYCGVEGIISTRVDLESLPAGLRQFVCEHATAVSRGTTWMQTRLMMNPMYKKTSSAYGCGVSEECRKIHHWKVKTFEGKQYGNQYQGLCGKYFSKLGAPLKSGAATGMNI
ncbi:hypothetical protein, conserved [Leishmania donovani]|uniref:EF-hand domain-containing protein n=1 Tax=Leishmania donovani TaxID=5661 RepID=E9BTW2_LEIDO|nr:hypothetical protein, conserved [Leishmania donovani]TPP48362.1 hypothetical protein CGC21_13560 [Leishmania donovani]CBZ38691.1 hypothetical protein, conserved [Leishmania donovani]